MSKEWQQLWDEANNYIVSQFPRIRAKQHIRNMKKSHLWQGD